MSNVIRLDFMKETVKQDLAELRTRLFF